MEHERSKRYTVQYQKSSKLFINLDIQKLKYLSIFFALFAFKMTYIAIRNQNVEVTFEHILLTKSYSKQLKLGQLIWFFLIQGPDFEFSIVHTILICACLFVAEFEGPLNKGKGEL